MDKNEFFFESKCRFVSWSSKARSQKSEKTFFNFFFSGRLSPQSLLAVDSTAFFFLSLSLSLSRSFDLGSLLSVPRETAAKVTRTMEVAVVKNGRGGQVF